MPLPCFYFSTKEVMALEYSNYPLGIAVVAACIVVSSMLAVAHPVWFAVAAIIVVTRGA